jgi:hypothetical protein
LHLLNTDIISHLCVLLFRFPDTQYIERICADLCGFLKIIFTAILT